MPFIVDSIIFRLFLIGGHSESIPFLQLLRGFLSDCVQCIPFIILYSVFKNKYNKIALFILFSVLISANTEHIIVNNGNIEYHSLLFIKDKEFIKGSALSARAVLLFLSSGLFLFLTGMFSTRLNAFFLTLPRPVRVRKPVLLFTSVILTYLIPVSIFNPNWQQQSFLEQNVLAFLYVDNRSSKSYTNASSFSGMEDYKKRNPEYRLLNPYEAKEGVSLLNDSAPEKNVLLILIEGLSQHQVTDNTLSHIKRLGEENFSAGHFITAQRQTNRGLYALFCGKYSNLVSRIAKADIVGLYGPDTLCLPEILRQNGYETVFLQGADLSFMRKDLFTRNIGFRQVIGNPEWLEPRLRTDWGIDDLTLYDSALLKIHELNKQNKKWFMSLLTVSTHHPYNVPGKTSSHFLPFDLPGISAIVPYQDALVFADNAVDTFIEKLRQSGILDDTLVIIMSDEANGTGIIRDGQSEISNYNFLSNNHGPFVALGRRIAKGTNQDQLFSQVDVPATALDYLNIDNPHPLGGRSIFRKYSSTKRIYFGNVYSDIFGYFDDIRHIVLCGLALNCTRIAFDQDALAGNNFRFSNQSAVSPGEIEFIKKIIDINDIFSANFNDGVVLLEKDKVYQGRLSYPFANRFKITGDGDKPVKIEFNIDNSLSAASEELTLEIVINTYKSQNQYASEIKIHPGEVKSLIKTINLLDDEEYNLDINVKAMNPEKWKANLIQIHYSG